jgi:hypothetical protein
VYALVFVPGTLTIKSVEDMCPTSTIAPEYGRAILRTEPSKAKDVRYECDTDYTMVGDSGDSNDCSDTGKLVRPLPTCSKLKGAQKFVMISDVDIESLSPPESFERSQASEDIQLFGAHILKVLPERLTRPEFSAGSVVITFFILAAERGDSPSELYDRLVAQIRDPESAFYSSDFGSTTAGVANFIWASHHITIVDTSEKETVSWFSVIGVAVVSVVLAGAFMLGKMVFDKKGRIDAIMIDWLVLSLVSSLFFALEILDFLSDWNFILSIGSTSVPGALYWVLVITTGLTTAGFIFVWYFSCCCCLCCCC